MNRLESRHWVFIGLFVVIVVSMLLPIDVGVTVSDDTQAMFTYLDSLPAGSVLIVSFDHEASSLPEISPLALAVLRHAFKKDLKLVGVALLAEGTGVGYQLMQVTAKEAGKGLRHRSRLPGLQTAVHRRRSLDGRVDRTDLSRGLSGTSLQQSADAADYSELR